MEALRYIQKIESDKLVIGNLDKFLGKEVEIIIIPLQEKESFKRKYEIINTSPAS